MKLNPIAVVFWIITGAIGYLIGQDFYSFVAGVVVGFGISFLAQLLP